MRFLEPQNMRLHFVHMYRAAVERRSMTSTDASRSTEFLGSETQISEPSGALAFVLISVTPTSRACI